MFEVEQKFWIDDLVQLEDRLHSLGAAEATAQQHADEYFNHPSRDFAETKEALRIRRIDNVAHVTYKGPKLPGDVKARQEMEWCLSPGDSDGSLTAKLWTTLGFRSVSIVRKSRRIFSCERFGSDLSITIDSVEGVGQFTEVELVVSHEKEVEAARHRIINVAKQLGLSRMEPSSYLNLLLATNLPPRT
jgi:adenylate cyclase, class 2